MDNLEEMVKFLERYKFPRLNQEETENMNRPITRTEIETVIKNLPTDKSPGPDVFNPSSSTLPKIAEKGTLPSSFYEATITLTRKPDKDIRKKENYRPISLMNIDAKLVNKIVAH